MRKRIEAAILAISLLSIFGFSVQIASATDVAQSGVVISQVQVKDSVSSSNEIVEIYNDSSNAVDITNWCVYYASKDYLTVPTSDWRKLVCFTPEVAGSEIVLGGKSYSRIISKSFAPPYAGSYLAVFTATLSNDAGHVKLVDNQGLEIDRVGWGEEADNPEGLPAIINTSSAIERKYDIDRDVLIDTNNNAADFFDTASDLCRNMVGFQDMVPVGYLSDTSHSCSLAPDMCVNIDGLQIVMPDGYAFDEAGDCVSLDVCLNLDGIQYDMPKNYTIDSEGSCINDLLPLKITELLPNPVGNDIGSEFIEIYNPNKSLVDLSDYKLSIGLSDEKTLSFPDGSTIDGLSYKPFYSSDLNFTLVNSSSRVKLLLNDSRVLDMTDNYLDPLPGMAWALVDSVWQYTDRITPGDENLEKSAETTDAVQIASVETTTSDVSLKPCAPNQYRNPETNRCRLIVADTSEILIPCKAGQYRSEETNRCRSIVADVVSLVPCSEGEERNPETNRCRSVLGTSTTALLPCSEGEERNPETNRCRKIVSTMPTAGFAVQPISDTATGVVGWWAFGGIGLLALGYAGWEWRTEVVRISRRLASFIHLSK